MRAHPGPDRPFGNVDVEALAYRALRIAYGVAEVIGGNRFEDHAGRVGFVFPCGCGEFIEALSALEHLEDSETIQSSAFLHGEFRTTPGTGGVWLCAFGVGHGGCSP